LYISEIAALHEKRLGMTEKENKTAPKTDNILGYPNSCLKAGSAALMIPQMLPAFPLPG